MGNIVAAILGLLLGCVLWVAGAFFSALFMYAGWNWGLVEAIGPAVHDIKLDTAFWLCLLIRVIGGAFKSTLNTNES